MTDPMEYDEPSSLWFCVLVVWIIVALPFWAAQSAWRGKRGRP
jgi:hypothetical protein